MTPKSLKILMLMAARRKVEAEHRAADAAQRLDGIDRQAAALKHYLEELAIQPTSRVTTGYDLAAMTRFAHASEKAVTAVQDARAKAEKAQAKALMTLAEEIERRDALEHLDDEQRRSAEQVLERRGGA
jgi:flagellar biosynthesis chaperone FliJ